MQAGQSGGGGFGPSILTNLDIWAWCALSRVTLATWEFRAIRAIAREGVRIANEEMSKKKKSND